ncbi:MAG: DUF1016 N-terminal domain-containing protein [Leptospirales bacterium]
MCTKDPFFVMSQTVAQLPWGQNLLLLTKLKTRKERKWYAAKAIEHGWSRNVMWHHISTHLHLRSGNAVTNFKERLPPPDSELAQQILKAREVRNLGQGRYPTMAKRYGFRCRPQAAHTLVQRPLNQIVPGFYLFLAALCYLHAPILSSGSENVQSFFFGKLKLGYRY